MRLYLVDGTYELFRAHFGAPPAYAPDGRAVGAVKGLVQSLLLLLKDPDVTHLACAFDHVVESFRNELFAGYKTGEGVPEELLAQFPLAEEAASALGIVVWPMTEFEADDALATAVANFAGQPGFDQVVVCTPDKDLAQVVRGNEVVCLDRRRNITLDEAGVWAKFGVGPASIPDYLALVGDAADGIPGISGWGAKASSSVLARYEHIERIPVDASDWEGVSIRGAACVASNLAESRKDALLYRELATLRSDVPLAEDLDDLFWRGVPQKRFEAFCSDLGLDRLIDAPTRWL
ncbi:MAG: flap endonuclease [Chloroflexi bacterium]|nr:flap endonuclease [Chloroflexota bacterium]